MRILLPVMIVVVIANYVAQLIHEDGVYEVLMKLKGYPYLEHSKDDCYDVFMVGDVMSSPPVTVREKERALTLVQLLRSTTCNGFPVVDENGRFKGLVRRKQIVALMECGIFESIESGGDSLRRSIYESTSSVRTNSGRNNQGLMHYAFHIKDNRYDYSLPEVHDQDEEMTATKKSESKPKRKRCLSLDITMPAVDVSTLDPSSIIRDDDSDARMDGEGIVIDSDEGGNGKGEDDLYQNSSHIEADALSGRFVSSADSSDEMLGSSIRFAKVGRDPTNNVVVISWLNQNYQDDVLDLEAVMNRGTYIVPEHCPLSKAYSLFTLLGLRWIVVVGGPDGGKVVGVLTRESFSESNLKSKTGMDSSLFH